MKLGGWQSSHLYSLILGSPLKMFLLGQLDLKYSFVLVVPCIQILLSCDGKIFQVDTENLNRTLIQNEDRGNVSYLLQS